MSERRERKDSGFACVECGRRFRTIAAAELAAFGDDGCPKCGGSDIDLASADGYRPHEGGA